MINPRVGTRRHSRGFFAKHRQSALRLGPGRFVLPHIPMFGADAVGDANDWVKYLRCRPARDRVVR
jgi:hypothetical protein